jgi:hypothetical protein
MNPSVLARAERFQMGWVAAAFYFADVMKMETNWDRADKNAVNNYVHLYIKYSVFVSEEFAHPRIYSIAIIQSPQP